MRRVRARRRVCLDGPGDVAAVHVGHLHVDDSRRKRVIGILALAQGQKCRRTVRNLLRAHAPRTELGRQDLPVRGVVVHDEDRPRAARPPGSAGRSDSACFARRAVNQKSEPCPSALSRPISPPISSTSRLEMARPRPVPPYRRVVEASACVNFSNSARLLLGRDADARVLDREANDRVRARSRPRDSPAPRSPPDG